MIMLKKINYFTYYKYRFKGIATILTCKCLSVQVLSVNG